MKDKLIALHDFCVANHNKGRDDMKAIDDWFNAQLDRVINEAAAACEEAMFRTAIQRIYYDLQNVLKWYLKRCGTPNKAAIARYCEAQLIMLSPFAPCICEEAWQAIGKNGFVSHADWPAARLDVDAAALATEDIVRTVLDDVRNVLNIVKIEKPAGITIITALPWKYDLVAFLKTKADIRNPGDLIKQAMQTPLKQHGQDIVKLIPKLVNKLPPTLVPAEKEFAALADAREFLSKEFGCPITIAKASETKEAKAGVASPGKPAIVVR
jgi:leucyl-tRNA synthetase